MTRLMMFIPVVLLSVTTTGFAQPQHEPKSAEERAREMTDKMVERLQLNDVQAEKVYNMTLQSAHELQPLVEAEREARRALAEARKQVRESRTSDLKEILSPEQFAELEKMKAERKKRMSEEGERRRAVRQSKPMLAEPDKD